MERSTKQINDWVASKNENAGNPIDLLKEILSFIQLYQDIKKSLNTTAEIALRIKRMHSMMVNLKKSV